MLGLVKRAPLGRAGFSWVEVPSLELFGSGIRGLPDTTSARIDLDTAGRNVRAVMIVCGDPNLANYQMEMWLWV
jgi:hypothetical protein